VADTDFDAERAARCQHLHLRLRNPRAVLLEDRLVKKRGVGESGIGGEAEQPLDAGAHILEPARAVRADDDLIEHAVGQMVGQGAQPLLGLAQGGREARLVCARRAEAAQAGGDHLLGRSVTAGGDRFVNDRKEFAGQAEAGQTTGCHHLG
jgi:hypothetical protein